MNKQTIKKELLRKISPIKLRDYLASFGWTVVTSPIRELIIMEKTGVPDSQIIIPVNEEFTDYHVRVLEIISDLSGYIGKSEDEILNDLLLPVSDIIRVRLVDRTTEKGTFPFSKSTNLFKGIREALYSAALSTIRPGESNYKKLRNAQVDEFINSCMLGQTERGSYIATVICPISGQMTLAEGVIENFGRKTTTNLMTSLQYLTESINRGDTDRVIQPPQGAPVVSSNLCEAITDLRPSDEDFEVNIDVKWAPEIQQRADIPSSVTLKDDQYPAIATIIERLNPEEDRTNQVFYGKVTALQGTRNEQGNMEGTVILSLLQEDELIRAKVYLREQDHHLAIQAYENGFMITITGTIIWAPQMKQISEYTDFSIVENR